MRHNAILLIGPTGSGKTPLGAFLEKSGLWRRRCRHFDFGEELRRIAATGHPLLEKDDMAVIEDSLKTGALLENEHFHIARKILDGFVQSGGARRDELICLNGLPRHTGQAEEIDRQVDIQLVCLLKCPARTVRERIRCNSGGDRTDRADDSCVEIDNKIKLFCERTLPLLDHYRRKQVPILTCAVSIDTTPERIKFRIEAACRLPDLI